ncbi:MAG: Ppx/GppA family phosphatase [Deltaproteobacteria bacterium]|nr:Ppx/GppA family phosphatase [Deltaproteobacteria bacterium]
MGGRSQGRPPLPLPPNPHPQPLKGGWEGCRGGRGTGRPPALPCMIWHSMTSKRLAAIDLGSLTVRLAVAERTGAGRFRILAHHREITALGEGLAQTGFLTPPAMARTTQALQGFLEVLRSWRVETYRAVATHAVRNSGNGREFLNRLRESLGLTVEVLSPEAEARLSLKGVLSALAPEYLALPALAVFDVGGGSSEFALVRPDREPEFASLPLGVLTLSQARPLGDPPQPPAVAAMKQAIERQLREFYQQNCQPHLTAPPWLVGTAGAVTTLAALSLEMTSYDPGRVNNYILTRKKVEELTTRLAGLTEAARAALPGLEPAKAGVMVAGALIIQTILAVFRQDSLVVIDAGLLEGVLTEMAV